MGTLYTTKAFIMLDSDGKRLAARYFTPEWPGLEKQLSFEKSLFTKAQAHPAAEIILLDNIIGVFRTVADVHFFVIGSLEENELVLWSVLTTYIETISLILKNQVDKRTLSENFDFLLLAMDELVDDGVVMETEPQVIADRVCMRSQGPDGRGEDAIMGVPMKTINSAKDMVVKGLGNLRAQGV